MSKNRHLSSFDYLEILQEEYICNDIRTKIYIRRADKDHYRRVLESKKKKIQSIAEKNSLSTIFDNEELYKKYWHRVVPIWGIPHFIYNQSKDVQEDKFPYKGTLVKYLIEGQYQYGFTIEVLFEDGLVLITPMNEQEEVQEVHYQDVEKLSAEKNDEFFYYFIGNTFKVYCTEAEIEIAVLADVDHDKKEAHFRLTGGNVIKPFNEISRIL